MKLFCCNDYQEYVQGLIDYRIEKEQVVDEMHDKIINKVKNERARELIKERAELRNMQILIAKQKKMEALATKKREQEAIVHQNQQEQKKMRNKEKESATGGKESEAKGNASSLPNKENKLKSHLQKLNEAGAGASKDLQNQSNLFFQN